MHYILLSFFLFSTACATTTRAPAAAPPGMLSLETALQQGPILTLDYLKARTTVDGFIKGHPRDPAAALPKDLRAQRSAPAPKEKKEQQLFFKKFRSWSSKKKTEKSQELIAEFECSRALEAQSLGLSLELDFPDTEATAAAESLHQKVLNCATFPRHESLFRLAIFSIQKNNCSQALKYFDQFPALPERGMKDRLAYLRGLCSGETDVAERNPWGGYGIRLNGGVTSQGKTPAWYLTTSSGSQDWDRLLKTLMDLTEQGKPSAVQHIAARLNYEKFRDLPHTFQASILTLMSFNGADLSVFQALHKYLSEHPEMADASVEHLLFPKRYWKEIVENTKDVNPVLVKALIRQESAFNPTAKSRAKAAGLMQLIYPTAKSFGVSNRSEWMEPGANIRAGSQFLGRLIQEFGSVELALAAYNAGPGMVRQWLKRYPTKNIDLFVEMIPFSETREYVRLVNRNFQIYQALMKTPETMNVANVAAGPSLRGPASTTEIFFKRTNSKTCDDSILVTRPVLCNGVW